MLLEKIIAEKPINSMLFRETIKKKSVNSILLVLEKTIREKSTNNMSLIFGKTTT